jgi:HSP20 family protein
MSLIKWSPTRDLQTLQEGINRVFSDAFGQSGLFDNDVALSAFRPPVDIIDTDEAFLIHVELPGVKKENVSIEMKENILTLKGERVEEKKYAQGSYYRSERTFGKFERSFSMPAMINPDTIRANFNDGVLEVIVPKPEEQKPRQITIS